MEDDRVSVLETQLAQAKLIAEEADKKYEEVMMENDWRNFWLGKKKVRIDLRNFQESLAAVAQFCPLESKNFSSFSFFRHPSAPARFLRTAHLPMKSAWTPLRTNWRKLASSLKKPTRNTMRCLDRTKSLDCVRPFSLVVAFFSCVHCVVPRWNAWMRERRKYENSS